MGHPFWFRFDIQAGMWLFHLDILTHQNALVPHNLNFWTGDDLEVPWETRLVRCTKFHVKKWSSIPAACATCIACEGWRSGWNLNFFPNNRYRTALKLADHSFPLSKIWGAFFVPHPEYLSGVFSETFARLKLCHRVDLRLGDFFGGMKWLKDVSMFFRYKAKAVFLMPFLKVESWDRYQGTPSSVAQGGDFLVVCRRWKRIRVRSKHYEDDAAAMQGAMSTLWHERSLGWSRLQLFHGASDHSRDGISLENVLQSQEWAMNSRTSPDRRSPNFWQFTVSAPNAMKFSAMFVPWNSCRFVRIFVSKLKVQECVAKCEKIIKA